MSTPDELVELHRLAEHNARLALLAAQNRNEAICAAHAGGMPVRAIARLLDLSENRVHVIVRRGS